MNLVLIETSGNQAYIFGTNKLRENVGASELTYRVGTEFVLNAVAAAKQGKRSDDIPEAMLEQLSLFAEDAEQLRKNLLDQNHDKPNLPIEKQDQGDANAIEVIIATSGKALLLVNSCKVGEQIISDVTMRALRRAPGLSVHGVISKAINLDSSEDVNEAVKEVHERLEQVRLEVPGVNTRFLRLPFVEPCATSGFPASEIIVFNPYNPADKEVYAYSAVTLAKYSRREGGYKRLQKLAPSFKFPEDIDGLQESFDQLRWLAVIHADGNGLGQIFLDFAKHVKKVKSDEINEGQKYLDFYRRFSLALDVCTVNAFRFAIKELKKRVDKEDDEREEKGKRKRKKEVPVLPLIVGGDDLTVLCEGKFAVQFAQDFLTQFERETANDQLEIYDGYRDGIVTQIANASFRVGRLASCAGIAIIKPHFPFHNAYELAEALLKSAKQVKEKVKHKPDGASEPLALSCSALDYHILFDASGANLKRIRQSLETDDGATLLYARPYIVTNESDLSQATPESKKWFESRTWRKLKERVEAMRAKDEDEDATRRKLPNSMLHELREGLFDGQQEADARMRLVRDRYKDKGFNDLLADKKDPDTLFFEEESEDGSMRATGFIDALDLVEFWADEEKEQRSNSQSGGGVQQ
jgi:hypothetical protein